MLILGIDPGLRITGYGVVEPGTRGLAVVEAGVILALVVFQRIRMVRSNATDA